MKRICIIVLCCTFGCSQSDSSNSTGGAEKLDDSSVTLEDLVYVDMFAPDYTTEHPLMCVDGGDFPTGREMAFRHVQSRETVHAVFPEGVAAPEDLDGRFALNGHYQGIQKRREGRLTKRTPKDYRYFVVSSWEDRNSTGGVERQGDSSITLEDLVNVGMLGPDEHPLMCVAGGDFPKGRETAFRHVQSGETVHAVFPEGVSVPEDLDGRFALHGHYQGIQKRREGRLTKRTPKDYRYFVVSSWEDSK